MSKLTTSEARVTRYSLFVIVAAFVVLSLVYSFAVPLFEGPDEIWHFAFANHLAGGGGLPVFDVNQPATFLRNGAHPPLYYGLLAALIAPIDRTDFPAEYRFNLASPRITPGGSGTSPNLLIHTAREDFPFQNTALAGHLARLVSIALGAFTVIGIFFVTRRLLRDERLALIATALVAFIPQFVYGMALVNNDALAAASATWLLYALLRLMDDGRWRWAVLSGVLLGIALLSKIGMIAVLPIPALALVLMWWRSRGHASRITSHISRGLLVYLIALLIAGWWYWRNFTLYGDPLMWREWQTLTGTGRVPPTPIDFLRDLLGFFGLFWADFSLRIDRVLWPIFGVIVIAAIAGLIRRAIKRQWLALDWYGLLVALAWLAVLLITAVRYSFNIYDIHGRLLYPALSIIAVLLVLGLSGWPKPQWVMGIALAIIMVIAVLAPLAIIQPAYARPIVSALPEGAIGVKGGFGVDTELLGYRLKSDSVKIGEPIEIETYWRSLAYGYDPDAWRADIALLAPDGTIVGHTSMPLGTDAYPREVWQRNEIVVTRFVVPTTVDHPTVATVNLTVQLAGVLKNLSHVTIRNDRACQVDRQVDVAFGGSIKLTGYRIEEGASPRIVLCWQALKPIPIDYTVFVHVSDDSALDRVISGDAQPVGGNYPTSAWLPGEIIEDVHTLPANGDLKIPQATIGLYRLDTGERLTIDGTDATEFELTK